MAVLSAKQRANVKKQNDARRGRVFAALAKTKRPLLDATVLRAITREGLPPTREAYQQALDRLLRQTSKPKPRRGRPPKSISSATAQRA